jgi:predicted nucleic acid-binding protein
LGSLILPESGLVYVDSQVLIYTVERFPRYIDALLPLWQASRAGRLEIATSELSVLEVITGPLKTGNQRLIDAYEELLMGTEIRLIPIDLHVLKSAARLRAEASLRTPDAIHAATAAALNCDLLVTNDLAFGSLTSINVQILKDIIEA